MPRRGGEHGEHRAGAGGVEEFDGPAHRDPKTADCRNAVHPGTQNIQALDHRR